MTMDEHDPWPSLRFRVPTKNNESMPVGGSDFHFDLDTRGFYCPSDHQMDSSPTPTLELGDKNNGGNLPSFFFLWSLDRR